MNNEVEVTLKLKVTISFWDAIKFRVGGIHKQVKKFEMEIEKK